MKLRRRWIGLAVGILLVVVVFAPVPGDTRFLDKLHDAAHGQVFGGIALLILLWLRTRMIPASRFAVLKQYAIAFTLAAVLGIATELAQKVIGGNASWIDVRNDALGAMAFLLLFVPFDRRLAAFIRPAATALAVLAFVAVQAVITAPLTRSALEYRKRDRVFPVIVDFTREYDRYFVRQNRAAVGPIAMPERWKSMPAEAAMLVSLQGGLYPGLNLIEPQPDWSAYSTLLLDLTNPGAAELILVLRIHDDIHDQAFSDRFNRRLSLPPFTREVVRIPLEDVRRAPRGRSMQLDSIAGLVLFSPVPWHGDFYVSRVWLE